MQQDGWVLSNNEICIVPARHFAKTYLEILAELHGSIPWSGKSPSKNKMYLASDMPFFRHSQQLAECTRNAKLPL